MKISQKAIELLQQRLKNIDNSVNSNELEKLANAVAAISKLETTDDILSISDTKLAELLEFANSKIAEVEACGAGKQVELISAKDGNIAGIATSKQDGLETIANASANNQANLQAVVDRFGVANDVPEGSTICAEISPILDQYNFFDDRDLPFIFGILSRYDDCHGIGSFTDGLGTWSTGGGNTMFGLLTGCHTYTNQYAAFYMEPKLRFLQGLNGNFIKKKSYVKYQNSTSQYTYPYAALGCLFVENPTDSSVTSTINFGGSSYSGTYCGASLSVGVPNHTNQSVSWTNAYSYTTSTAALSNSASVAVPANTTVAVLFYTSSYIVSTSVASSYSYHAQFLEWRLTSVRSGFLKNGLKIDFDKTLKAWQSPGFSTTYDLWRQ